MPIEGCARHEAPGWIASDEWHVPVIDRASPLVARAVPSDATRCVHGGLDGAAVGLEDVNLEARAAGLDVAVRIGRLGRQGHRHKVESRYCRARHPAHIDGEAQRLAEKINAEVLATRPPAVPNEVRAGVPF